MNDYTLPRLVQLLCNKNTVEAYLHDKLLDNTTIRVGKDHLKLHTQLWVYVGTYINSAGGKVFFVCLSAAPIPKEQWDQLDLDHFGTIEGDLGRHNNATAWEIANDYMMMESTR